MAAQSPWHYWLLLHPDLDRPVGGVKQMHRLAESFAALGRPATLVQQQAAFHPGWFTSQVTTIGLDRWQPHSLDPARDVLVLPETFLPHISRYPRPLAKIIFNQNGAYCFGLPQDKLRHKPALLLQLYQKHVAHVLCVSEHDERLLRDGLALGGDRVSRLVNGLEAQLFNPAGAKRRRIAYMPRKNGRDAAIVAALLTSQPWFSGWELVPIIDRSQAEVAEILKSSLLFLAFGHPEGFGLPLAEALACGCHLIGYSGLGGRELLALAAFHGAGEEVAFGDWLGFVDAIARFDQRLRHDQDASLRALLAVSKAVRARYGGDAMQRSLAAALPRLEANLLR